MLRHRPARTKSCYRPRCKSKKAVQFWQGLYGEKTVVLVDLRKKTPHIPTLSHRRKNGGDLLTRISQRAGSRPKTFHPRRANIFSPPGTDGIEIYETLPRTKRWLHRRRTYRTTESKFRQEPASRRITRVDAKPTRPGQNQRSCRTDLREMGGGPLLNA